MALGLASKGCRVIIADIANLTEAVEQLKEMTDNPLIIGNINIASIKEEYNRSVQVLKWIWSHLSQFESLQLR